MVVIPGMVVDDKQLSQYRRSSNTLWSLSYQILKKDSIRCLNTAVAVIPCGRQSARLVLALRRLNTAVAVIPCGQTDYQAVS